MKIFVVCQDRLEAEEVFGVIKDFGQSGAFKELGLECWWDTVIYRELKTVNIMPGSFHRELEIAHSLRDYLFNKIGLSRTQIRISAKIGDLI